MVQISVIIPCYNQEKYIAEALDSVLEQTFKDFEIIVINDGSTDNSANIIKSYVKKHPQIIRYIGQRNQGVIAARNNAIAKAQGEYIFPLDGDDKIAPNCLSKLYEAMINKQGDVIYCDGEYFGERSGKIIHLKPSKFNMTLGNHVFVSSLYRKSDWTKYGGYDEIMKDGYEDWEFWLNFVEENKRFHKIDKTLFFYRILNTSRNSKVKKILLRQLTQKIKIKHPKLFDSKFYARLAFYKLQRFCYQKKVSDNGDIIIRLFRLPIYHKRIKDIK